MLSKILCLFGRHAYRPVKAFRTDYVGEHSNYSMSNFVGHECPHCKKRKLVDVGQGGHNVSYGERREAYAWLNNEEPTEMVYQENNQRMVRGPFTVINGGKDGKSSA